MSAKDTAHPPIRSFGRRRGKVLRQGRSASLSSNLEQFKISPPSNEHDFVNPASFFTPETSRVWLEIGFGNGEHLLHHALNNPDIGMIGCEPFVNGIAALCVGIEKHKVKNIRIWPDDARLLMKRMLPQSIDKLFLINSDPWPKTRHHKRRFIQKETLDEIHRLLKNNAEFRMATDHAGLASWQLEKTYFHGGFVWAASAASDWRTRPVDAPETRYQQKGVKKGHATTFLNFIKNQ